MNTSVSPALQKIESALGIPPNLFAKHNYHSVFDIICQSRSQFITNSTSWLGTQGGHAWDLAIGQAQHIRRLFRENHLTRQGGARTDIQQSVLALNALTGEDGLLEDGPDWQNQFGDEWSSYCQPDAPEAENSPVSYLTWLYGQAIQFEKAMTDAGGDIIPLSERRPDLAKIRLDNNAINQKIPALTLVNDTLKASIAGSIATGSSVDKTLASTRYPPLLPYHFSHDQTGLSLQNADIPLEDIINETSTDWPWFLNNTLTGARSNNTSILASQLAPEQLSIITEGAPTELSSFYKSNLGLSTADYSPFTNMEVFTRQLDISVSQSEHLTAGSNGVTTVTWSPNIQIKPDSLFSTGGLAPGRFDTALSLYNSVRSCAWFDESSPEAIMLKGDKDFSVCMWVNISANPTDHPMPVIANSLLEGGSQGISLCINDGCFRLAVADTGGQKTNNANKNSSGAASSVTYNTWYFLCLTWSNMTKTPVLWYQKAGATEVSKITVDMSALTGSVITSDGFTWVLNDSGDFSYYATYPTPATLVNCRYDDIGIFNGVLTTNDVERLASSGLPLVQVGLSLPVSYYNSLNYNPTDRYTLSALYGASFINAGRTPAVSIPPAKNELQRSNARSVEGKYGDGIEITSSPESYLFFTPDGTAAQTMKGDKSFTLGCWIYKDGYSSTVPLFSNTLPVSSGMTSGFFIGNIPNTSRIYTFITSTAGIRSALEVFNLADRKWTYIALSWDAEKKIASWYGVPDKTAIDKATYIADVSSQGEDFTTAEGLTWAFGAYGDLKPYAIPTEPVARFIYNDIAVFDGALTPADINAIVNSGKPVTGMDLSGLSATCIWTESTPPKINIQNLSDARMDRINRMVRLQRWLGLSSEETDLLLNASIAAQGIHNTDYSLNTHTLRALGVFRHWQKKYGVSVYQFAAVLHQITPYAISPAVPFLDQVFNSPSLFTKPFAITNEVVNYGDEADSSSQEVISQLCAGLGLTRSQLQVLADKVATQQGDIATQRFTLTLNTVSALYRLAMIPRWLKLPFADGVALFSLVGNNEGTWNVLAGIPLMNALSDPLSQPEYGDILDILMALDAAADWGKQTGLSWNKGYIDLQPVPNTLMASSGTVNFANGILQQLPAALLSEESFAGVPFPDGGDHVLAINGGFTAIYSPLGFFRGIKLDSTKGEFAVFPTAANLLSDNKKAYTIGLWLRTFSDKSVPLFTNTSAYDGSGNWFNIDSNGLNLECIASGTTESESKFYDKQTLNTNLKNWFYFSFTLSYDESKKLVFSYYCPTTSSQAESFHFNSAPPLSGWILNENSERNYFINQPNLRGILCFDDLTLWDRALTSDEIKEISDARKPANQIIPATMVLRPSGWKDILRDLIDNNGLVRPGGKNYNTIATMVSADIDAAGIIYASASDKNKVIDKLSSIIYQALLTQQNIADSALAQMFSTSQALSPFLFRWAGDSEYRLLAGSLILNDGKPVTNPDVITAHPSYLKNLYALGQRADIALQFHLTPTALSTFLTSPGWLDRQYTSQSLPLSLSLFHRLSCYKAWLNTAIKEDVVLAYLSWVNTETMPDTVEAANMLADQLGWYSDEVKLATAELPGKVAKTVADVGFVMRLHSLSIQTGLSVMPLLKVGALTPGNVTNTWDDWVTAGNNLAAAQSERA